MIILYCSLRKQSGAPLCVPAKMQCSGQGGTPFFACIKCSRRFSSISFTSGSAGIMFSLDKFFGAPTWGRHTPGKPSALALARPNPTSAIHELHGMQPGLRQRGGARSICIRCAKDSTLKRFVKDHELAGNERGICHRSDQIRVDACTIWSTVLSGSCACQILLRRMDLQPS